MDNPISPIKVEVKADLTDSANKVASSTIKPIEEAANLISKPLVLFNSIWDIAFGGVSTYAKKTNIKRLQDIETFKKNTENKIHSIPKDKVTEPKLSVIGPTLEASKYYFEEEDLRKMFENIASKSFNKDFNNKIHPSFIEIIKQLSPVDTTLIIEIFEKNNVGLITARAQKPSTYQGVNLYENLYFIEPTKIPSYECVPQSISNLARLGLINISHETLTDKNYYSKIRCEIMPLMKINFKVLQHVTPQFKDSELKEIELSIQKTPFGQNFYQTCVK